MNTKKNSINKISRKVKCILSVIGSFVFLSSTQANAVVDVAGGLSQAADEVEKQLKSVAVILFGLGAVICLVLACWKLVGGLVEHNRQGTEINWKPIVTCFIATIVCSLFSVSTFFGWFGV